MDETIHKSIPTTEDWEKIMTQMGVLEDWHELCQIGGPMVRLEIDQDGVRLYTDWRYDAEHTDLTERVKDRVYGNDNWRLLRLTHAAGWRTVWIDGAGHIGVGDYDFNLVWGDDEGRGQA
ncbi:MAG: hypothetical protein ACQEVA_01305 [Myxococcota bacterium]